MSSNLIAVICLTRTVCLTFGNYIIKITSRRIVGKLLLKLPSSFFPKYRVVVSNMIIEHNKKMRQSIGYQSDKNTTTDYTTDDDSEAAVLSTDQESQRLEEMQTIISPPLRKITAHDLKSIQLRKCQNWPETKNFSEIDNLLAVLRKRFAVMHSPYGSETETDFDDETDNYYCNAISCR